MVLLFLSGGSANGARDRKRGRARRAAAHRRQPLANWHIGPILRLRRGIVEGGLHHTAGAGIYLGSSIYMIIFLSMSIHINLYVSKSVQFFAFDAESSKENFTTRLAQVHI